MDNPEKLTREVTQWLAEIGSLRQQLIDAQNAIAEARQSAEHWRSLYNTEAEQRRREAEATKADIALLQQQLAGQRSPSALTEDELRRSVQRDLETLDNEEIQVQFVELCLERDRLCARVAELTEALEAERANHAKTRTDLTSALGDTVALLAKAKGEPPEEN